MNPSIQVRFPNDVPAWVIEIVPIGEERIENTRSIGLIKFKDISPGLESLFDDFKNRFISSQSLEHWSNQASTTYFDNLVYVLDKVLPIYGLTYQVGNRPPSGLMKKNGGFFSGLIK